jgi:uncharacterized protein YjbI with pentapeptide repeats
MATNSPDPPPDSRACDACRDFGWKHPLAAEFRGTYHSPRDNKETEGQVCILHHHDAKKDAHRCAQAVEQKKKNGDFNFSGVWISCPVSFCGAIENPDFSYATFDSETGFVRASFSGRARFFRATFRDEVDFNTAAFQDDADFFLTRFRKAARFVSVHFTGKVDFSQARFGAIADLSKAVFGNNAEFSKTVFAGIANFSESTFVEEAAFCWLSASEDTEGKVTDRKVHLDFGHVRFRNPDKILFRDVDMSDVSILGTDLSKVYFINATWPRKLRDEREATAATFPLVENLCRQLKQNYDAQSHYLEAGRFYYGEMEMRRKANPWRRFGPSLITCYWLSSGYGQRPLWAFLCVLALIFSFSSLYMMAGLQLQPEHLHHATYPLEVRWFVPQATWSSLMEWAKNFFYAFLHTSQVLVFTRSPLFAPVDWKGELLKVLQVVPLPWQFGLMVLSWWRYFRR